MKNDQAVKFCWGSRTNREPGVVGQVCNPTRWEVEAGFKSIISYKMSLRSVQITWDCLKCSKTTREYERRILCCTMVNFENAHVKQTQEGWDSRCMILFTYSLEANQAKTASSFWKIRIGLWFRKAGFLSLLGHFLDRFQFVKSHQVSTAQIRLCICFILQ